MRTPFCSLPDSVRIVAHAPQSGIRPTPCLSSAAGYVHWQCKRSVPSFLYPRSCLATRLLHLARPICARRVLIQDCHSTRASCERFDIEVRELKKRRIAVGNGASIVGRIVPLIAAQKLGVLNVLVSFALTSGVMQFLWTLAKTATSFLTFMAFYGISSGEYGKKSDTVVVECLPCPSLVYHDYRSHELINQVHTPPQSTPAARPLLLIQIRQVYTLECSFSATRGSGSRVHPLLPL